jgi:hypothetical protein
MSALVGLRRDGGRPTEGNKKAKERLKLEGEATLLRDKFDQMMKSKEVIAARLRRQSLSLPRRKKR